MDEADLQTLFDGYVRAREDGEPIEAEAVVGRAPRGAADDLRQRIGTYEALRELGALLGPDEDVEPDLAPRRLGRYVVLGPLGSGGFQDVYAAEDPELGRRVALKVFDRGVLRQPGADEWLEREGRSLAQLEHPGVVRVYDTGSEGDVAYIAMELVEGPSLRSALRDLRRARGLEPAAPADDGGAFRSPAAAALTSIRARCELAHALADAFAYCHKRGVVHRDVKPENILLRAAGEPVVIDFGLAHLDSQLEHESTVTRTLVGTLPYLSPEQIDSGRSGVDPRSDVFSLGTLLYELLTLRHPFLGDAGGASRVPGGARYDETLRAISRAEPERPRRLERDLPADLERIVLHCLERDPDRRYARMDDLAADLDAFLTHRAISLPPPGPIDAARSWLRRHRRGAAIGAALLVAATAVPLAAVAWDHRQDRERWREEVEGVLSAARTARAPTEFETAWTQAAALGRARDDLNARVLARLWPASGAELGALLESLSTFLATALDAAHDDARAKGCAFQVEPWRAALRMESEVHPASRINEPYRELGGIAVELPEQVGVATLRVFEHRTLSVDDSRGKVLAPILLEVLRPEPPFLGQRTMRVANGLYRLVGRDTAGRVVLERELTSRENQPRALVHAAAPRGGPAFDGVLVSWTAQDVRPWILWTGELDELGGALDERDFMGTRSFFLARRPVTWGDVARRIESLRADPAHDSWIEWISDGARRCPRVPLAGRERLAWIHATAPALALALGLTPRGPAGALSHLAGLDEPARLRWELAVSFASSMEARLPTALELAVGLRREGVARAVDAVSELSSSPSATPRFCMRVKYDVDPLGPEIWFAPHPEDGSIAGIPDPFRLARSED